MDLNHSEDDEAFRLEVQQCLRSHLPDDIRLKMKRGPHVDKQYLVRWQRILNKRGWAVPHWPVEWGGTDWTAVRRLIFYEELLRWPAPEMLSFNVTIVGPVLIAFGSDMQKRTFLPKLANLDLWFCQGFSEPNSGSDLASLSTKAVRDGDTYVISGQKI